MDKEVKIENMKAGSSAIIKHKGSFEELNLIYKQINKWVKDKNFGIFGNFYSRFDFEHNDLSSNNILFELGIRVKEKIKDKNFVKIVEVPGREVISALYKGPYLNLHSIHQILADYARKNDLAPMSYPTEIYLNDPLKVKSNELLTEVQFPILDYNPENIQYVPLVTNIEKKTIKKQKMLVMEHYGFIEDVFKVRVDLLKWAEKHSIEVKAFHFKYHANPDGISPEGMVFRVGIPVDRDVKKDSNMKIVENQEHEVLSAVYKGPYVNIPSVARMMVDYAFENNLEIIDFAEEIYLNSIFDVSCDDLLTEVRMDVMDFNFDRNIKLEKEIERKIIKKHEVAFIRQTGSFEKINKIKTDLFNWVEKNNIKVSGHHFLRFINHPSLYPENISYEIGIPIDSNVEGVMKVLSYPKHKTLSLTHTGSISTLKDTHEIIKNHAEENKFQLLGLPVTSFVDKIPENHEEELLIKVRHPARKI
ncbi:MAG: GyrI-like domain-containing protein [Methanobacteriaceae archaeon]|jgi:effector-binding domain-containing protein|nr:GyrI-like domain-containing protein [Candidatus Methanorudis spinitermitis]